MLCLVISVDNCAPFLQTQLEFPSLSEYEKCLLLENVLQVLLYEYQIQQQFYLSR